MNIIERQAAFDILAVLFAYAFMIVCMGVYAGYRLCKKLKSCDVVSNGDVASKVIITTDRTDTVPTHIYKFNKNRYVHITGRGFVPLCKYNCNNCYDSYTCKELAIAGGYCKSHTKNTRKRM